MAGKKVYAVKRGKITGLFHTWEECRASVEGYPQAQYKGFASLEEAEAYLGNGAGRQGTEADPKNGAGRRRSKADPGDAAGCRGGELPEEGWLLAYVDGSYEDSVKKYAFGCVFLTSDGHIYVQYGNGDREQSLQHRNVTGEMLGAMYAVKTAMMNGFRGVEVRYDYQGIEKWVTGEWRAKTELTGKYAVSMREWGKNMEIRFQKVAAHTNVRYNELADQMAKRGLREGNGIPKVCLLTEMEEYRE